MDAGADLGVHPTRSMATQWAEKKDGSENTCRPGSPSGLDTDFAIPSMWVLFDRFRLTDQNLDPLR